MERYILSTTTFTFDFNGVNEEELNSNKDTRSKAFQNFKAESKETIDILNEIMEDCGLQKFEFIPDINLTTIAHCKEIMNISDDAYSKQINRNPELEDELRLHGAEKLKSSKIIERLNEFTSPTVSRGRQKYTISSTRQYKTITLENGTEFKCANGETWYLTPEAVLDFCMVMRGKIAVAIRSAIINKLKSGHKAQNTLNNLRQKFVTELLDLDNSRSFDEYDLQDFIDELFKPTSYKDKRNIKRLLQYTVNNLNNKFTKAQTDLAGGVINNNTYNKLLLRINMRRQSCQTIIIRLADELEEARKQTEETLSESNFTNGNVNISVTEALKIWYSNNPSITKSNQLNNASNLYKKFETFGILTGLDSKLNRKLTDEYKFIKNSFILPETLMSFSCKVNKYGYAFIDIILSIYYGKLILGDAKYNKNNYTMDDAEAYIIGLTNKKDDELKEEITSLIITRVQNNCYALL